MRRVMLALLLALLPIAVFAQDPYYPTEWNTEGIKTNPTTSTVLCQFQLPTESAESHRYRFVVGGNVAALYALEQMDAANTTALRTHIYAVPAFATFESTMLLITLNPQERLRLRPFTTITGSAQCSMFVE